MWRMLKALASAIGIMAVVVGVPIVLVQLVGWPGPDHVPSLTEARRTVVQRDFGTAFVLTTLVILGWILWAQVTWATAWELIVNVSQSSHRRPNRPPPFVAAPIGRIVAIAVMSVMAVIVRPAGGVALSTGPLSVSNAASVSVLRSDAIPAPGVDGPRSEANVTASDRDDTSARQEWTVGPGDTLWDIAERVLGDGARVDELVDANRWLTSPDALRPGMKLVLPAGVEAGLVADRVAATVADEVVVKPGDNLWNLTEDRFGETNMERIQSIADANAITNPDLIYPGDRIDLEPGSTPQTADERPDPPPKRTDQSQAVDPAPQQDDAAAVDTVPTTPQRFNIEIGRVPAQQQSPETSVPRGTQPGAKSTTDGPILPAPDPAGRVSPPFGGQSEPQAVESQGPSAISLTRFGITASGILALLAARRRRQLRAHLAPGRGGAAATEVERQLRDSARGPMPEPDFNMLDPLVDDIDNPVLNRVNRIDPIINLVYEVADQHHATVRYIIDDPTADRTEVIFDAEVVLASPWAGQGQRWSVAWVDDPAGGWKTAPTGDVNPAPAVVLLGTDADQRLVYGDLETIRALEISGPEEDAAAIASAIGMALASRAEMSSASFVGTDVPSDIFLGHDGYLPADSFASGLAAAKSALGSTIHQPSPLFRLRLQTGEPWEPVVVIVGPRVGRVEPIELTGAALVSAAPIHGPSTVLSPDGDSWVLRPGGISITPCGISSDEIASIWELFARADSGWTPTQSHQGRVDGPHPGSVRSPHDHSNNGCRPASNPVDPATAVTDAPLTVGLFAGMTISGPDGSQVVFRRAASRELVAWLVTHRDRSTKTGARASIWNFQIRAQAFSNVLSDVRRSLNAVVTPPPGDDWVGHSDTERLPLHPGVQSDADVLRRAVAEAEAAPASAAISTLRPAVDLIEAAPFETTSYLWPETEGLASELALLGADAALRLAEAYESVGDVDGVLFATERGLRVIPGHERLTAMRMAVVGSAGDESAVAQTWNDYEQVLCDEPWAPADASPELIEIRRGLGT